MTAWRRLRVLGALGLLLGGAGAQAHSPTQLYAWSRLVEIDLQPDLVRVRYGLAAGEALGQAVRQALDLDRDGRLDADEQGRLVQGLVDEIERGLTLQLDDAPQILRHETPQLIIGDGRVMPGVIDLVLEWNLPVAATPTQIHQLSLQDRGALLGLHDTRIDVAEQGGTQLQWSQLDDGPRLRRRLYSFVRLREVPAYQLRLAWHATAGRATAAAASSASTQSSTAVRSAPSEHALAGLLSSSELNSRLVALAVLMALILGALHALSPGHGKTLVAAYLVGRRGTVGQAILLGLVVTLTHVASVLALGAVTLWLSTWLLPAQLLPWLELGSGLLVLGLGLWMLGLRWRAWQRQRRAVAPRFVLAHAPRAGFVLQARHLGGAHPSHDPDRAHGHAHLPRAADGGPAGLLEILVLGVTGGMVPCPSALVVLLTAVALQRIALGLLLIAVFSLGLASVLVAIGILVVKARQVLDRLRGQGRVLRALPVVSAALVTAFGVLLVLESVRGLVPPLGTR